MKNWFVFNLDKVCIFTMLVTIFLDACLGMCGVTFLSNYCIAVVSACVLAYLLYYNDIAKSKAKQKKIREARLRKQQREREFYEEYANYKRARRESEGASESWY